MQSLPGSYQQLWVLGLLGALAVVSTVAVARRRGRLREVPRSVALGVGAATTVALLLALLAVEPAFVHISMHGPLILESILSFPSPDVHRHEFGQGGYVVLGLAAALFGRSVETVMVANAVLSATTTPLVAFVAARWSGRPSAALYAAAAWATSPFIARLARSEDVHVVAMLFVFMALAWAEVALASGSRLALFGAVLSIVLALWTRQSTYLCALLVAGVLVERRRRAAGTPALAAELLALAVSAILAALAVRVVSTLGEGGDAMLLPVLLVMARHPGLALANVLVHPFLSPLRLSILVPTLGLVGSVYLVRRSPVRISFALYMAAMLVVTLPASYRSVGVQWSFRLPLYALALVAVGVGGAVTEHAWEARRGRPLSGAARLTATAACGLVGLLATGTLENRAKNAELVEYTFVRGTLGALPPGLTLVTAPLEEPSSELPARIAQRLGVPAVTLSGDGASEPPGPWVFFEGLACHAHSLPQLFEETLPGGKAQDVDIQRFLMVASDPRQDFGAHVIVHPTGLRAACAKVAARTTARLPEGPLVKVDDDPPMLIYDTPRVHLRLRQAELR